jgi:hypothetical protein
MPIFDTDRLPQAGRNEDSALLGGEVAHISRAESDLLRSLGGAGTINPVTGLPEYYGGQGGGGSPGAVGLGGVASPGFGMGQSSVGPSAAAAAAAVAAAQGQNAPPPPPPPPSYSFVIPHWSYQNNQRQLPTVKTNAYVADNPGIYVTDSFGNYVTSKEGVPIQSPILTAVQQAQKQAAYQMAVERGKQEVPQYRLESKLAEPPPSLFQKVKQGIMQVVPDVPLGKEAKSLLSSPLTSFLSRSPVAVIAQFLAEGLQAQTPENVLATTIYNANPVVQAQQASMNQPYPTTYSPEEAGIGSLI